MLYQMSSKGKSKSKKIFLSILLTLVLLIVAGAILIQLSDRDSKNKEINNDSAEEPKIKLNLNKEMIELNKLELSSGYIMVYTKTGGDSALDQSLHLAYSKDAEKFTPLNSDNGICFAKQLDGEHSIENPFVFYLENGDFGVIAVSSSRYGKAALYTSSDLVSFDQEIILDLGAETKIYSPQCYYDNKEQNYVILWTDGENKYKQTTSDFRSISSPVKTEYEEWQNFIDKWDEDILPGNIIGVDQVSFDYILAKLKPVTNTGIKELTDDIYIKAGEKLNLDKYITAYYSDGSMSKIPVDWELYGFDNMIPGEYTLTGRAGYPQYDNPFIESKADPWIIKGDDGKYYFTASYPMHAEDDEDGYSRITLRSSDTIEGLQTAEEVTIWHHNELDNVYRYIWAPEIHQINGIWYIFFTGSTSSDDVFSIRPHLLKCEPGENPMKADSWTSLGRVKTLAGDPLSFQTFSLDMTYFEANNKHYVVWAEKTIGDSLLYIARIDSDDPSKLISMPTILSFPEFAWERIRYNVNEGPAILKRDGKIFLCFSAAGTGPEYCIGLLTANENADLLLRESWEKTPYPILTTADVADEFGPGHNSFTTDQFGNDVFVYHARSLECYSGKCNYAGTDPLYDPCRHARIKTVHWAFDGIPVLKMTEEQFLRSEYRNISVKVTVTE